MFDFEGNVLNQFSAYEEEYRDGVQLAMGDVKGIGKDFIITSPTANRTAHVRIFNGNGRKIHQFKAFKKTYTKGITVAVQDAVAGDPKSSRIVVGKAIDAKPVVKVMNWRGKKVSSFLAYKKKQKDGVQVYAGDVHGPDGVDRIVTTPMVRHSAKLRVFTNRGKAIKKINTFEDWQDTGFTVTNIGTNLYVTHRSQNSQAAVRKIEL